MKLLGPILYYIVFIIVLALLPLWFSQNGYANLLVAHFWMIFFYLSGLTFAVVVAILIGQQVSSERGTQMFLAATVFKILACLVFALVFLLKNHINKLVFVADFFYIYFLNMAFEIYTLLRNLRNQKLR